MPYKMIQVGTGGRGNSWCRRHLPPNVRKGVPVPLLEQPKWANAWLVEKFVRWLDGGEPMETNVGDNLQSVALIFAAIESSRTGQLVQVREFLAQVRGQSQELIGTTA